jgi:hypothetical protein
LPRKGLTQALTVDKVPFLFTFLHPCEFIFATNDWAQFFLKTNSALSSLKVCYNQHRAVNLLVKLFRT